MEIILLRIILVLYPGGIGYKLVNKNTSSNRVCTGKRQSVSQALFDDIYVIFPIHFNFATRSMCVLKATILRKKQRIVLRLLEKVFSFSIRRFLWYCTCKWYLINFFILSRSVSVFHVSLSIIYLLFLSYHVLYARFFLNICLGLSL